MFAISAVAALGLLTPAWAQFEGTILNVVADGPVTAEYRTDIEDLDSPKLKPATNATTYDWWYFDAVSASTNASVSIVFYNTGEDAFINNSSDGPLSATLSGTFDNGTAFFIGATAYGGAELDTSPSHAYGAWLGTGFSFRGENPLSVDSRFVVGVDAPDLGVQGTVTLDGRAESHLPCGETRPGGIQLLLSDSGWSNAVPDADADVDLHVGGTALRFDGAGYHDKNWGERPLGEVVAVWYWGHARLGPYSVVWLDALAKDGQVKESAYVSRDGDIVVATCAAVVARPWGHGEDDHHDPGMEDVRRGMDVRFDLGESKTLVANVTTEVRLVEIDNYVRLAGSVEGRVEGPDGPGEVYTGKALFEEFNFE